MSDIQVNPYILLKVVYFQPKFWEKVMQIFNFRYFYLKLGKQHINRIQKKSGVRIFEDFDYFGFYSFLKNGKKMLFFMFQNPKKGYKIKINKIPKPLFLNNTKMTLRGYPPPPPKKTPWVLSLWSPKYFHTIAYKKWGILT